MDPDKINSSETSTASSEGGDNSSSQNSNISQTSEMSSTSTGGEKPSIVDRFKAKFVKREEDFKAAKKPDVNQPVQKTGGEEQPQNQNPNPQDDAAKARDAEVLKTLQNHPEFKKVAIERDALKNQVTSLSADSEDYQVIRGFLDKNSIPVDEMVEAMQMLALRNQDPEAFYQKLFVEGRGQFEKMLGITLSPELQTRVDNGDISADDARKLSMTEARANLYKNQTKAVQTKVTQNAETQRKTETATLRKGQETALNTWEDGVAKRDPDYNSVLRPFVHERIQVLLSQGAPKSVEEAVALGNRALKDVKDRLKSVQPKKTQMKPIMNTGSRTNGATPPKNGREIVRNVMSGRA